MTVRTDWLLSLRDTIWQYARIDHSPVQAHCDSTHGLITFATGHPVTIRTDWLLSLPDTLWQYAWIDYSPYRTSCDSTQYTVRKDWSVSLQGTLWQYARIDHSLARAHCHSTHGLISLPPGHTCDSIYQGVKFLFFLYSFLFFGKFLFSPIFTRKPFYFYYFLTVGAMQLVNLASIFSLFCYSFVCFNSICIYFSSLLKHT